MSVFNIKNILDDIYRADIPNKKNLVQLLNVKDAEKTEQIFDFADSVREKFVGNGLLLRGIVEFSNICINQCLYCGLNRCNKSLERYELSQNEIIKCVDKIAEKNIKTVVLQSGDYDFDAVWLNEIIQEIKRKHNIVITLSVGEKNYSSYKMWRKSGADRYLLKIETTDKNLYKALHPCMDYERRLVCLNDLRELGYQVGSGIMVGLPKQTIESIADDIRFFKLNNFGMIGIGPFVSNPNTELSNCKTIDVSLVLKTIALTRIVTKNTHMPVTTASVAIGLSNLKKGLLSGANVFMPNFTPDDVKNLYDLYPGKNVDPENSDFDMKYVLKTARIMGRAIDYSFGDCKNWEHVRCVNV